jgi:tyrosine-protein kinase Etk/Wzc
LFGLPHGPGLVELLRGEARLAEAVRPVVGAAGLSVLTTSGLAETGDLLARSMHAVLNAATAQYDVVIIDTPPLLAGDDAGTIATMSDAVLLVVSNGVEIRRLGEAARILDAIQARVIGVLLNRTEVPSYGYTYRNLGGRSSQSSGGTTAAAS